MRDFYNTNKDFRDYVDRYSRNYMEGRSITVKEALEHELIRNYAEYLLEENEI